MTVSNLRASEEFYDHVIGVIGFRKRRGTIGGDPRGHYYNRHYGHPLRSAREDAPDYDRYSPGLHHSCFRMIDKVAVDRTTSELGEAGVYVPEPRYYPEYTPDVHCRSGSVRLEVPDLWEIRRKLVYDWEDRTGP